ncbi:zinc finger protein ZIPIC-like isoform X2 [Zophobas morio]|uniref:zinc finger protein ZIPIC-like isoform X2 n=1 Tax=Zophobas morio TaxID=2755281 RepID=UPI003083A384
MSQNNLNLDENEIHYVYDKQEYILGGEDINSELRDLICSDGSKTILVDKDGQYIIADNQAVLLQEGDTNLTQYYINDNSEGFVVDGEETSGNTLFESTECIQLVEEDTNEVPQIIYYSNDDSNAEEYTSVQEYGEDGVVGVQDEEGNIYPFKRIRLEGQLLNFEDFVQQANLTEQTNKTDSLEYAILEDANHLQSESYETSTIENSEKSNQSIDLSKITGRNLITGQTVTLHSYMEKLKKRLNKTNSSHMTRKSPKKIYNDSNIPLKKTYEYESKKPELSDLLDKKISIGTTKSGKRIVGKIIHVEKRGKKEEEENNLVINDQIAETPREEIEEEVVRNDDPMKILVKKCTVSIESFEQISKTLGGVMEMESVRKKLENKNIVVKLVEKKYVSESDSYVKNTSYSYGYMEQEFSQDANDEIIEKWKFVPDQDTQDVLLGQHFNEEELEKKTTKFPVTTSLTILVTHEKAGNKTIRVNLNPAPGNLCTICAQYFKTNLQLRYHMQEVHNTYGNNNTCEICEKTFDNMQKLTEHRNIHVQEGKLFVCLKCNKSFGSRTRLQKHMPTHDVYLRPLECSVCEVRCASEWALKKHLLTHAV